MKNFNLHLLLLLTVGFFACNSKAKTKSNNKEKVEANLKAQEDAIEKVLDAVDAVQENKKTTDTTEVYRNMNGDIIEFPTEFTSELRLNESILLNQIYTDTIEFSSYDDNYDYYMLEGKKNGKIVSLITSKDWSNNTFKSGDIIKVKWRMERISIAGDEEILHFSEREINAELVISENDSRKTDIIQPHKNIEDFLPEGYIITEKNFGDLNKDGQEDCILLIKGTDKNNFVINRFEDKVDRNRRGIIVLFKNQDNYQLAAKNYDCFYSENEDGGVYYPPELSIRAAKGILIIDYAHGRYGYWSYKFRYQDASFKLIGYDASDNYGPIINSETSINFLTQKKLFRENINADSGDGQDEVFKETWKNIAVEELIQLSKIKDFEGLDMSKY